MIRREGGRGEEKYMEITLGDVGIIVLFLSFFLSLCFLFVFVYELISFHCVNNVHTILYQCIVM